MKYNIADLDIDVKNRDEILQYFKHIPASKINDKGINPHGVGVYFSDVPIDLISGLCSVDYKSAEEDFGYVKIDLLHNTQYDAFNNRTELLELMDEDIDWNMLSNKDIVEKLPHINNYFDLLQKWKPKTIDELAMFLAVIRPNKSYLINTYDFNKIKDIIWIKEENKGYFFKKSHAIAYAVLITLMMRKMKK